MPDPQEKEQSKSGRSLETNLEDASDILIYILVVLNALDHVFHRTAEGLTAMDIINNIVAPLIVALITWALGRAWERRRIERKIDAAPKIYVQELDKLIARAMQEGPTKAVVNARAIVSARNSMRKSLVSISSNLNSEIDRLAVEIGEELLQVAQPSMPTTNVPASSNDRAFQTIEVLSRIWPSRREEIVVQIRKLLAELGLGSNDYRL